MVSRGLEWAPTVVVDVEWYYTRDVSGGGERNFDFYVGGTSDLQALIKASEEDVKRVLMEFTRVDFGSGAEANPELVEAWRSKLQEAVGEEVGRKRAV